MGLSYLDWVSSCVFRSEVGKKSSELVLAEYWVSLCYAGYRLLLMDPPRNYLRPILVPGKTVKHREELLIHPGSFDFLIRQFTANPKNVVNLVGETLVVEVTESVFQLVGLDGLVYDDVPESRLGVLVSMQERKLADLLESEKLRVLEIMFDRGIPVSVPRSDRPTTDEDIEQAARPVFLETVQCRSEFLVKMARLAVYLSQEEYIDVAPNQFLAHFSFATKCYGIIESPKSWREIGYADLVELPQLAGMPKPMIKWNKKASKKIAMVVAMITNFLCAGKNRGPGTVEFTIVRVKNRSDLARRFLVGKRPYNYNGGKSQASRNLYDPGSGKERRLAYTLKDEPLFSDFIEPEFSDLYDVYFDGDATPES